MKAAVLALALAACGYSSTESELVGQVKKVVHRTPLVCGDYYEVDVSLGIIRNGTGSMSKEDVVFYAEDSRDVDVAKEAAEGGRLVRIKYDIKRVAFCTPDHYLRAIAFEAEQ